MAPHAHTELGMSRDVTVKKSVKDFHIRQLHQKSLSNSRSKKRTLISAKPDIALEGWEQIHVVDGK